MDYRYRFGRSQKMRDRKTYLADPRHPDDNFRRRYRRLPVKKQEALWLAYLDWRKSKLEDDFGQFEAFLKANRDKAREDLDAIDNLLQNGKKGEPYHCRIELPASLKHYKFVDLDKAGLEYTRDDANPLSGTISGTPSADGEYIITLIYAWHGWQKGFAAEQKEFTLRINPDPKELWRDIPTPEDLEFYKPDTDGEFLATDACAMLAASRRGRSHAHSGLPRDDDFAICHDRASGWYFMAVADGAGSAEFSRKGSQIAVNTARDIVREKLASSAELNQFFADFSAGSMADPGMVADARKLAYSVLPQAAFDAHKMIREKAREKDREARLYATTLLMVLARPVQSGWVILSFQVGDGAMAILGDAGGNFAAKLLAEPDEGEYGGQTRFITMKDIFEPNELMKRVRVDFARDFSCILLMTDGISDAFFATLSNLQDPARWQELWQQLLPVINTNKPVDTLLEWLNFWSQGNHDDRTLAMLYPVNTSGV